MRHRCQIAGGQQEGLEDPGQNWELTKLVFMASCSFLSLY